MKNIIAIIFSIITLAACDKAPINGDLDGMWKMTYMEKSDGTKSEPYRIFFCFELNCIELSNKGANPSNFIGRMSKEKNRLSVSEVKNHSGDKVSTHLLEQFGISQETTEFNIEKLNNSTLIIKSKDYRLQFTKF